MSYKGRDIKVKGLPHQTFAQCPQCDKRLMGIPFMYAAVVQSTRTCPKCHTTWRILARPNRRQPGFAVTTLEWVVIS